MWPQPQVLAQVVLGGGPWLAWGGSKDGQLTQFLTVGLARQGVTPQPNHLRSRRAWHRSAPSPHTQYSIQRRQCLARH